MKHYAILTKTRNLEIQWEKVLLLTKKTKTMQITALPPPYNQIKMHTTGTVLGKMINMHGEQNQTIIHRLKKAKKRGGGQKRNYPRTKSQEN